MSDGYCDVSLGDYDGDPAKVFHAHTVTARKPHVCDECKGAIEPGQKYERVSGLWDRWQLWRFCLPCSEIQQEFSERGRTFGILWDTLYEEWGEGATLQGCLNRVTSVAAKEHMRQQWLKWKRL